MAERNETVEAALAELDRFGLKGQVRERGKHLEVGWEYPDGRKRLTIVSRTASDHRSALNTRGDVRRQLRADSIQPPPARTISFQKALSLPKASDFAGVRLAKLEQDVEALLDLVVELQGRLVETNTRLANAKVVLSFEVPKVVEAVVSAKMLQPSIKGARSSAILEVLHGRNWVPIQEIVKITNLESKNVSSALDYLRRTNKVEHGQLGM